MFENNACNFTVTFLPPKLQPYNFRVDIVFDNWPSGKKM